MQLRVVFVLLVIIFLGSLKVCAQTYALSILDTDRKDTMRSTHDNFADAVKVAQSAYYNLLDDGYLLAQADTEVTDSGITLAIRRNERFKICDLNIVGGDRRVEHFKSNEALGKAGIYKGFASVVREFENEGYPFASIRLDSIQLVSPRKKNMTSARVFATIIRGPLILNDSLHIRSSQPLPSVYLKNYIDFRRDDVYNEQRIQQTERRLREIPFIQVKRSPEIRFTDGKADLFLFIDRKKANYFNGVAGLRPDEATGKVNITGDAEVRLLNAFNRGEELGLIWRKLQPLTQDLSLKLMLPYLFNTSVALDGKVQIYKRDTSFISVKLLAGAGVLLPRNQRLRVFVEKNRSNQLTKFYSGGSIANAEHTLYGLSVQLEMLDYRWNPRRGYSIFFEAATGYRTTNTGFDFGGAETKRSLNRSELQLEYFIPVFKRQAILISTKGSVILSDSLYENEVFRIGGLRTIRGINEESIFATSWGVATIEYRWLLEENSAIYVFADQAWYEYKRAGGLIHDIPFNAGVGFNFETKAGIFTFNYALGKQFDNPVLVRNGKISFGFRSLF